MPEFFQNEGERCIENLLAVGATAIVTSPCVAEPDENGTREPPAKGAYLDRLLWGRNELRMSVDPSWVPDEALYRGTRYPPPEATDLTRREGHVVGEFIARAKAAGLEIHLRIQAAAPPGLRAQFGGPLPGDEPRLPDGSIDTDRLDRNASLACPDVRAYLRALIIDLCRNYPEADGFHVDWAEHPPYSVNTMFFDFSEHARRAAERHDLDFDRMRKAAAALKNRLLGSLRDADLKPLIGKDGSRGYLLDLLLDNPGLVDAIHLKRLISEEVIEVCRDALDVSGDRRRKLTPMAFPPPFTLISGFNYARTAVHADAIALKLIPSHWSMILRSYGDALTAANPGLSESLLVRALLDQLDIQEETGSLMLDEYRHPRPDEVFRPGQGPEARKIAYAQQRAGDVPVIPLLHSLGPADDFRERLSSTYAAAGNCVWINRYAFLSNEKLAVIGELDK